jgi:nucleoside-diphosphate-sugar epimerase
VVHLAWLFQPTHRPLVTWRANVLGTLRLVRAVVAARVPALVHASSVGAYSPGPADDHPVDESWPTHGWPLAAYTREKAYLERALDTVEREHPALRVVRMRPAFVFQRGSASQQRRLFGGPFVPGALVRPGLVPFVPDVPGLRFQALHAEDAARACLAATLRPVRGAFNLAGAPPIHPAQLAELLDARAVPMPAGAARAAVAAAWHAHLVPASPDLFDAVLRLPLLSTGRAREYLGWEPRWDARDAVREMLAGLRAGAGEATPPLEPGNAGPARARELAEGVGG